MVGLFINTLPLRIQTNSHETARELLYRIDNALQMLKEFEVTSTVNIKKYSEIDNTEELFDSIVVIENYPLDSRLISGSDKLSLSVDSYSMVEMTHYDLTIAISIIRDMEVTFSYNEGLFEEETIVRLAHHFRSIVKAILTDPGKEIAGIEIISREEKDRILFEFNKPGTGYPGDKTAQQLFAGQVERTPDYVAMIGKEEGGKVRRVEGKKEEMPFGQISNAFGENSLRVKCQELIAITYKELNKISNRLAHILKEKGVKPDTIVGIKMERSIEIIVSILAILKAGGAYLPIDPGYPEQRIQYMLNDSNASILLTHQDTASSHSILTLTPTCQVNPTNLAYVIYNSGSMGKPKGVMVEHRNLTAYIQAFYREFVITANDTVLQQASFAFDAFVEEVYPVLLKGGKIALPSPDEILDIHLLLEFIAKNRVTLTSCSPLLLKELNRCKSKELDTIHTFISGGDVLRGEYIDRLLRIGTVYNTYGPTETTVCVTYYKCLKDNVSTIPIGKPISNYKVYILGKDDQLFEEQVERTPDYIAIVGHNEGTRGLAPWSALMSITYQELN